MTTLEDNRTISMFHPARKRNEIRKALAHIKKQRKEQISLIEDSMIKILKDEIKLVEKIERNEAPLEMLKHSTKLTGEYIRQFLITKKNREDEEF